MRIITMLDFIAILSFILALIRFKYIFDWYNDPSSFREITIGFSENKDIVKQKTMLPTIVIILTFLYLVSKLF